MKMELELKATQTITPQLIATMTVLQYGAQELREYLSELSYENPMLELHETTTDQEHDAFTERLRWLRQSDWQNRSYYAGEQDNSLLPIPAVENNTLEACLTEQLLSLRLPRAQQRAAEILIQLLDAHGFFCGSISEVARLAQCTEETARAALDTLLNFEPAGVGTGNVQESLLLQLKRLKGDTTLARRILQEQFHHLSSLSPLRLAALLKAAPHEVEQALALLSTLTPFPSDSFSTQNATIFIQPDLYICTDGTGLTVRCAEDALPQICINRQYLKMLETEQDPAVQKYLRGKLQQFKQVVHDLNNRKSTILRCCEVLARRQQAFFQGGTLQKLTLRDVAQELEVHESTVSRTVRDKYIQCDRGLFPMSYFFSRGAGQNTSLCRENIQEMLAEVIAGEDTRRPYSDETLTQLLSARHIVISRRAVAKYRAELGIWPANVRKRVQSVV